MKKQLMLIICSISSMVSCDNVSSLSAEDISWMPYSGDETLIFKSNLGEVDTIFLVARHFMFAYPNPLSTSKNQMLAIVSKHADPYDPDSVPRYLTGSFLKLEKKATGHAVMHIDLSARDASFYRRTPVYIDSLTMGKPMILSTTHRQYDDIYIIPAEDDFNTRGNYVTKIYWSKVHGLVRYDKRGGVYWELSSAKASRQQSITK